MAAIVLHNLITFACAFFAFRHRSFNHDASAESSNGYMKSRESLQRSQASVVVLIAFTLSVCFGRLHLINPAAVTLRVLFSLSVASTGLFILGMFCFYVDDVRRAVLPKAWQGESTEMTVPISFHNIGYEGDGSPCWCSWNYGYQIHFVNVQHVIRQ